MTSLTTIRRSSRTKGNHARNAREAQIASIMDVLQEIEDEDPTLMIEARERRRAAKLKERPARSGKSSARKKPTGEDLTTHRPLDFGSDPSHPPAPGHGFTAFGHSTLPNAAFGGSVFSGMIGSGSRSTRSWNARRSWL